MKLFTYLRMALILGSSGLMLHTTSAQTPMFNLGTPSGSGNTIPFYYTGAGCRSQHLMPAGVFGTVPAGYQITTIYFASTTTGSQLYNNFNVLLKQANITTLSTTYETGMTPVLSATGYTINRVALQYFAIPLTTPFPYDPTLPIIVEINQQTSGGSSHSSVVKPTIAGSYRNYAPSYNAVTASGSGAYMLFFGFDVEPQVTGPNDAGIASINKPIGDCEGTYDVEVTVRNYGTNQINPVTINWEINGVPQTPVLYNKIIDTVNGALGNTANVVLGSITLQAGNSDKIVAWTSMPNNVQDTITDRDSSTKITTNLPLISSFPYFQDFEAGQADWAAAGVNSSWAFGTPAKTTISGAASGVNAFVTGGLGTGLYNVSENSAVNSPCYDFSGFTGTPWVALDVWWNCEATNDGAALQVTTDGGETWENVGASGDPNNWYNNPSIAVFPANTKSGWSGRASTSNGSGGWKRAKHTLDPSVIGKQARFRILFGSGTSNQDDGVGFDNFTLVDFNELDLGPKRSLCGLPNVTLTPGITINGTLKWFNGDSTSATMVVTTTGKYWATYHDPFIDESSSDSVEIVQSAAPKINIHGYADTITKDGQTTLNPNLPFDLDYLWTPNNVTYPFLLVQGKDYTPGPHTFVLKVTDSLLCVDQKSVIVVVLDVNGIGENEVGSFRIYPNPARDILSIEMTNIEGASRLEITDLSGKVVREETLRSLALQRNDIDISELKPGSYVIRLMYDNQAIIHKLVKE